MKKIGRRIMSGILCLACIICLSPAAFAAETSTYSDAQLAQIEREREALYSFLEEQLAAQDALQYIDEFAFLVDMTINSKYNINTSSARARVYAPNGGFVYGYDTDYIREAEFMNTEVTQELLQYQDSPADVILEALADYALGKAWDALKQEFRIVTIEDLFPEISSVMPLLSCYDVCEFLQDLSMAMMWERCEDSGSILTSLYDKGEMRTTTVVWPWSKEPYIDLSIFPSDEKLEVLTHD